VRTGDRGTLVEPGVGQRLCSLLSLTFSRLLVRARSRHVHEERPSHCIPTLAMSTRRSPTPAQSIFADVIKPHSPPDSNSQPQQQQGTRKALADIHAGTRSNTKADTAAHAALHASVDTTRSALDTSASSSWSSRSTPSRMGESHVNTSSSDMVDSGMHSNSVSRIDAALHSSTSTAAAGLTSHDTSMECNEQLELSFSEISSMADAYPELAARALELANQTALDRVHIQSLQQQLQASTVWQSELEQEVRSLRVERDAWQAKAEQHEGALRHTQILMACMKMEGVAQPASSGAAAASATSASPAASESSFFSREISLLRSHHRAALDAKDALLSEVASQRDAAQAALRQLREEYSHALHQAADTRYNDAVRSSEQRERFQKLVESQLNAQRHIIESHESSRQIGAASSQQQHQTMDAEMGGASREQREGGDDDVRGSCGRE
jgi:hypothetical protein